MKGIECRGRDPFEVIDSSSSSSSSQISGGHLSSLANTTERSSHFIFSKMRVFGFWVLFMVLGTAFMFLAYNNSSSSSISSFIPGTIRPDCEACLVVTKNNRKLKEKLVSYNLSNNKKETADNLNVEDYPHFNPVPSSKANIHSGPIEHGTPLMPFIPKATPPAPSHPKRGTSNP